MSALPRASENPPTRRPIELLTPEEMRALLRAASGRAPTGIRNRALIVMGWRAGLRVQEFLGLFPRDLDPEAGTVNVTRGKGGRQRFVGLDPTAFAVIERWLDKRRELGLNGHQPVFCTLRGKPLKSSYVRAMLPRLARRAGIEKRVHAHGLRHAHAAELAAECVPMNVIARQLGHRSVVTTSRYIDHIQPTQVIETMRQRNWSL
jgi:site-specific recombinase XerD